MSEPQSKDNSDAPRHDTPWRVEGSRDTDGPRSLWRRPPGGARFWLILGVLLSLNLFVSAKLGDPEHPRQEIPYSSFLERVEAGDVAKVKSEGTTIHGQFDRAIDAPGGERHAATRFQTIRPGFADEDDLLDELIAKDVEVSARLPEDGRPLWQVLLLGFGPTVLLVALFVFLLRRVAGINGLGRSKAKRYQPNTGRTRFSDVAGIDEAQADLVEIVDFLKNPDRYRRLGGMVPRGVLLADLPAPARRCWRAPSRARRTCRSSRSRRPSSWRWWSASAPAASATCSRRPRRRPPRSSSSTSSTRSGAHAAAAAPCRPRRARADAQPDPHRDGRLLRLGGRHRPRRDQPDGDPRPGAHASRAVRPAGASSTRPTRSGAGDPRGAHPPRPAGRRRRTRHLASTTTGMVGAD